MPWKPEYSIRELERFLENDPDPIVIFYGGEPLLNPKFIMKVMDGIEARYGIQTNGTIPNILPKGYWERMETVLLSIDGVEWLTDKYRGNGVYRRVIKTAKWLSDFCECRKIARMTVTKDTCIYRDVIHLLELGYFTHIHWQLNVVWSDRWSFLDWAKNRYLRGIANLVQYTLEKLVNGHIPGIVPFLGILTAEKTGGWGHVPCGAGLKSFSIATDGRILACPIAVSEKWAVLGDIWSGIKRTISIGQVSPKCEKCDYYKWCGGRCLYSLHEKYWGDKGQEEVCWVTKKTIDHVLKLVPVIDRLDRAGIIKWNDLMYDPLRDSTEIIP
jgi:putative peptide-modifying radical SAM enzyme